MNLPKAVPRIALPIMIVVKEFAFAIINQPKMFGMYAIWTVAFLPILSVNIPAIRKPIGLTSNEILAKIEYDNFKYYTVLLFISFTSCLIITT